MTVRKTYYHVPYWVHHVIFYWHFRKYVSPLCRKSKKSLKRYHMAEELNYNERKEWAKLLYTTCDKSAKEVALEVNIDESQVRLWEAKEQWQSHKRYLHSSKANRLELLHDQITKLHTKIKSEDTPNPKDMDLLIKYSTTANELEEPPSVSEIIDVFESFIQWLRKKDQPLTKKLIVQLDAFVTQKIAA